MRQLPAYMTAIALAIAVLSFTTSALRDEPDIDALNDPLVDVLTLAYEKARRAASDRRFEDFRAEVDDSFEEEITQKAHKSGFISFSTYLGRKVYYWPDLDTLVVSGLHQSETWARLTAVSTGGRRSQDDDQLLYTFLLFKKDDDHWRMAGLTLLKKKWRDIYGNEVSYHETDLPPHFRFPRTF